MKTNHIVRRAVTAALVLGAAPAFAYVPNSNTDGDVIMNWAGASASTLSAMELTIGAVCDANAHLLYVPTGSGANPNEPGSDWAIGCEATAGGKTGFAAGTRILVIKRDRGGSGVGVGGVQTKATDNGFNIVNGQIDFLTLAGNCGTVIAPATLGAPNIILGGAAVPLRGCAGTYTTFSFAEMGTSDIEPNKFFGAPNTPSTGGPFRTEADRAFAKRNALAALLFNTPVTLSLYQALQAKQFGGTPLAAQCTPGGAQYNNVVAIAGNIRTDITNGDSELCMPSLTVPELASIFGTTGTVSGISDWNRLLDSTGATVLGGSFAVQIARRSNGSGTQATFNALLNRYPCDPNLADGTIDVVLPKAINGTTITSNSDSAAVAARLQTINGTAANPYGIGILSVEGRNVNYAENWRYIKIDGVAPTLRNMHAGDYSIWAQQSCQLRNLGLPFNAQGTLVQKTKVYDLLCLPDSPNSLNKPAGLTKINNPVTPAQDPVSNCTNNTDKCASLYRFGQAGWLATPTSTLVYDNVLAAATNPVNAFTREVTAGNTNICAAPMKANAGGGAANAARGMIVAPNPEWTP
jgi:ABC-type phosphate transport system substrate-binding protein